VQSSIVAEIEDAFKTGSSEKRTETLRRVTDLFLKDADRLNEAQIGLFDDVLIHLIKRIETKVLIELSEHLAPVDNAPIEVMRRLARDDEISVAGPVLAQSARLTTNDLVEIAETKSSQHLLAISDRNRLEEAVTDVLLDRGGHEVVHRLARNAGARFSEVGFTTLVKYAEKDESLAEKIGLRPDLPLKLLRELLLKATEAVRSRLLSSGAPERTEEIQQVIAKISNDVRREAFGISRNFTLAHQTFLSMQEHVTLNEEVLLHFATEQKYEEMVAALAVLCSGSIELISALVRSDRYEGLLVPCKAADLKWPTVDAILGSRLAHGAISDAELAQAKGDYVKLSPASAQRTLRFWQVRVVTKKGAG